MNKEMISTKQGIFLIVIFILGTTQIFSGGGRAKQDLWISILIAIVAAMFSILIYGKLISMFPGKNLFQILDTSFGKTIGTIISLLYIFNFFHLGAICMRNITEFIQIASLNETPQYFSAIWVVLLCIYMVKGGFEVFARWTNLILVIIFFLILVLFTLSIPRFNYDNILPILYNGWKPVFHSALSYYTFPFAEVVVFLALFNNLDDNKKIYKVFLLGIIIGGFIILVLAVKNTLLLGLPNLSITYFPSYYANSLISAGKLLQRVEVWAAIMMFLTGIAKVCTYLFAICIGISHLIKHPKYSDLAFPIGLLMVTFSIIIFSTTMQMIEFLDVSMYLFLPFQLIIPVVTLAVAGMKKQLKKTQ